MKKAMQSAWVLTLLAGCATWAGVAGMPIKASSMGPGSPAGRQDLPKPKMLSPDQLTLEKDLENIKKEPVEAGENHDAQPTETYKSAAEADLDIQLLYDLIRAVEYEANAELFEQVLKDLDIANYPITGETEAKQTTGPVKSTPPAENTKLNAYKPPVADNGAINGAAHDADIAVTRSGGVQGVGRVSARQQGDQGYQSNARVPLHKRLAQVLQDVPGTGEFASNGAKPNWAKRGKP